VGDGLSQMIRQAYTEAAAHVSPVRAKPKPVIA